MEALLPRTYPVLIGNGFLSLNKKKDILPVFSNGTLGIGIGFGFGFGLRLRISSVRVEAKKSKPTKKQDTHSFAPESDEGFFPEAVLLKEKKLQEDGRYLPDFADAEEEKLFESLHLDLESQLDVDTMRHYEVVYLVHEKYVEDVCKVNQKVQDFLKEKKGTIWRMNDWGMRSLAYKIQDAYNANYILLNFELGTEWINDFKDMLDKDERVIRHLVMKRKSAITESSPPPPDFNSFYDDDDNDDDDDDDDDDELYMGDDDDDAFDDDLEDDDETYEDEDAEDDGFEDEDDDGEADGEEDDDDAEGAGADSDEDTDLELDEEESDYDDDNNAKSEVGRISEDKDGKGNGVAPKTSRRANVKMSRR